MLSIRSANNKDFKKIEEIRVNSWKYFYKNIIPSNYLNTLKSYTISNDESINNYKNNFPKDAVFTILEKRDVGIIGFAVSGKTRDSAEKTQEAEIYAIYISHNETHLGYGKILFDFVLNELKIREFKTLIIWVLEENYIARKFYESTGGLFTECKNKIYFANTAVSEVKYIWRI